MDNVVTMSPRTFSAKLFEVPWETASFTLSGTLDGHIDLATPNGGTYPLSLDEAQELVRALNGAIADVQANCLYERDALNAQKAPH